MLSSKNFSFLYAAGFLLLVGLMLTANFIYLTDETDAKLRRIFWKQSEVVTESIAMGARQAIQTTHLAPEYLNYYAENLAHEIESLQGMLNTGGNQRLEELRSNNQLEWIQFLDAKGAVVYQAPKKLPETSVGPIFSFERLSGEGSILISLGEEKLINLRLKLALQELADSSKSRQLLQSISFYDQHLVIVADTDPTRLGQIAVIKEIKESLDSKAAFFPPSENQLEVIQYFVIDDKRNGVFHMAINTDDIDRVLLDTKENTRRASLALFAFVVVVVVVILRFQFQYLDRMAKVEKEKQENEKMVSLGNLAAGVAHEIRNPLNSISITIQRLQLEFEPPEQKIAQEYQSFLGLMNKEVQRLNQIVSDFLGFAKPFEPNSASFAISQFWGDSLTLIAEEAKQREMTLKVDLKEGGAHYYGDAEKLKQVVLNLIGNAMDANAKGGQIQVRGQIDKRGTWIIEVEDNGEGIPKEKLGRLFDIYYTTKQSGTGLGLYISRKIVQAHGGSLDLHNNPKQGVTAAMILPKRENKAMRG